MEKGLLIVISGFSGVGKGTVIPLVRKALPNVKYSVSCTSRAARHGEVDGVNYYFLSEEEFNKKIENDEFLEYTRTFTNMYGTLKSEVDRNINLGYDLILELNVVGANRVQELYPDCLSIFIVPPSIDELKRRLIGRGSESPESIERRLNEIDKESKELDKYNYVVVNEDIYDCANEIIGIINNYKL